MTIGRVLRDLDAMNSLGLSMTWKTIGFERYWCYEQLSVVDDMSHFVYEQLRALDAKNSFGLWLT